ncbi:MAG: hypothetical protein A3F84_10360 [Candidatus Handelsmanbacteria bacterium RIFCSPLOWO2_12_FULL_64_10]|uniref:Uncharacterized protein n=1 Tax=Handelsmanbacteria sp. (strain RIFCSPLOWO2_12_FULL_64_10) TaxID=1817868 RepID=A0A1F6CB56_HANXR|nr:MAG: hypothetical protein A3F84_10360 [Candidatus Handelsmanbacteria bacterium RIFCSPLOWO2_12_FULL_64_10]
MICGFRVTRKGQRIYEEVMKGLKEGQEIPFADIPLFFGEEFISKASTFFDTFERVFAEKGEKGLRARLSEVPRPVLKTLMFTLSPACFGEDCPRSLVNELVEAVKAMAAHRRRRARR